MKNTVKRIFIVFYPLILFSIPASVLGAQGSKNLVIVAEDTEASGLIAGHLSNLLAEPNFGLLRLEFPADQQIERTFWEDSLRPKIVAWLNENDPNGTIEDVITVYGTPLMVGPWEDSRELGQWRVFYETALRSRIDRLDDEFQLLRELAGKNGGAELSGPIAIDTSLDDIRKQFDSLFVAAQAKIDPLQLDQRSKANDKLRSTVNRVTGLSVFVRSLQKAAQSDSQDAARAKEQLQYVRGRNEAITQAIQILERVPATFERESSILPLIEQQGGLLASIAWLKQQLKMVEDNHSAASFDSELALVLWPEYRRLGTTPNLNHPAYKDSPLRQKYRTLNVMRIDGPTPEAAMALVDCYVEASKVDKPEGKVYVDLRAAQGNDAIVNRNEGWLKSVANQFKDSEGVELVVEDTAQLFPEKGCPDTLLYTGWYSLEKYIDSFTFKPGAIAYHLTPGDALGIHDPESNGWCKNMIEKGATLVVGSVSEPEVVAITSLDPKQKRIQPAVLSSGMVIFGIDGLELPEKQTDAAGQ